MSQSTLAGALAAGATIVTPNNRLARDVVMRFDASRQAEGKHAWTPAHALPWSTWLERSWFGALAARAVPARALLDPAAARELWHAIIVADRPGLLDPRGAAQHAVDAWTLFHAWREVGEALPRVSVFGADDDAGRFARWAERYRHELASLHAIDRSELADTLNGASSAWTESLGRIAFYAFIAPTPQQARLIDGLRTAGVDVDEIPAAHRPAAIRQRTGCATTSLELAHAFGFARARLAADPGARVAIVVADLERQRDEVIALAEEILCPEALRAVDPDAPRPYGISLGEPLANVPIVACALDLIALSIDDVDATVAACAIRSPFLPGASTRWMQRAGIERGWREEGRREVTWAAVVAALRLHDPWLQQRFAALQPAMRGARLPRDWARAWSDWLSALGWPGDASLTSGQWQAREAWSSALARFAASGMITGALTAASAAGTLRVLLAETLFAPETPPAPIQILGVLEAAGLSFDCAWLAGFDANRWPPAATPNPLLPLSWQHLRGVTRSHPEAALADAQRLTAALAALANEVIVSHPKHIDDAPAVMSPLFASWPGVELDDLPGYVRPADAMPAASLQRYADDIAPSLAIGTAVRGGAALFESQSACPFQAFGRFRLRADAWAACPDGLSAMERGSVLHAVLKAFWDDVRDHTTLVELDADALARAVDAAVAQGKARLSPARWRALPAAVAQSESRRLATTLRAWIDDVERPRPPFRVRSHEQSIECPVEGITARVRIDRIDVVEDEGLAIIDYKSGRVVKPARWFGERPEGVQLAVYAHGIDQPGEPPLRALAYAQVKAGEIALRGIAESYSIWPGLDVPGSARSSIPATGWTDARAQLQAGLSALARQVRDGVARVAPRARTTCRTCGLQPLCRIRMLDDGDDSEGFGMPDE